MSGYAWISQSSLNSVVSSVNRVLWLPFPWAGGVSSEEYVFQPLAWAEDVGRR